MKKRIFGFVIVLIAFSLLACSNEDIKVPTIPTPTPPEQVTPGTPVLPPETPITPTETPVIPPETPVTPSETPVIPPETPTPDVPDTPIRNPEEVLQQLLTTSRDHYAHCHYQFEGVSFLSVEDAEAVMEGKKEVTDGWHVINAGGYHIIMKLGSNILPSFSIPSNYIARFIRGQLYIDVPGTELSSPQPDYSYRVLEDGRILEYYLLDYLHSDIERYVIYDTVEQIFGS